MNPIEINKNFFLAKEFINTRPILSVNTLTGFLAFNQAAIQSFDLIQVDFIVFLQYPSESLAYFTASNKKTAGFKITKYSNEAASGLTHMRICSKHLATYLKALYKVKPRINNFKFYLDDTLRLEKEQHVFSLTLIPESTITHQEQQLEEIIP